VTPEGGFSPAFLFQGSRGAPSFLRAVSNPSRSLTNQAISSSLPSGSRKVTLMRGLKMVFFKKDRVLVTPRILSAGMKISLWGSQQVNLMP